MGFFFFLANEQTEAQKEASSATEKVKALLTCLAVNIIYRHRAASAPFPTIFLFTSVMWPRQGLL